MELKLINNTTKHEVELTELEDKKLSRYFYSFDLSFNEDMEEGEWTYQLFKDGKMVANGLLQIGDYTKETIEHNTDRKGFISYNG